MMMCLRLRSNCLINCFVTWQSLFHSLICKGHKLPHLQILIDKVSNLHVVCASTFDRVLGDWLLTSMF